MKWIRLLPIGLVFACLPLIAAPAQREVSSREARQIGKGRQKDALRHAKKRQREVAREIKSRDRERRHETKQLTKSRPKPEKPAPVRPKGGGPSKDQPSPNELLRGYSGPDPKQ